MERRYTDKEVEILINSWQHERCLWDVASPTYANRDATKAAKKRVADAMEAFTRIDTQASLYFGISWILLNTVPALRAPEPEQ